MSDDNLFKIVKPGWGCGPVTNYMLYEILDSIPSLENSLCIP